MPETNKISKKEETETSERKSLEDQEEMRCQVEPDSEEVPSLMSLVWQACCNSCPSYLHETVHTDQACNPQRCGFVRWMSYESPSAQCIIH